MPARCGLLCREASPWAKNDVFGQFFAAVTGPTFASPVANPWRCLAPPPPPPARQSILEYNGAAILAMTGKNCVGICSDSRLGNQAQTVATDFEKIFKMGDKLMVSGGGSGRSVGLLARPLIYLYRILFLKLARSPPCCSRSGLPSSYADDPGSRTGAGFSPFLLNRLY